MYELVIVWNDGTKQIFEYDSEEKAEKALEGMYMALGRHQLWGCVRRKIDRKGV